MNMLPEISRSMLKNSAVLGLFAVVTVGVVTLIQQATAGRIEASAREAQVRALGEILPPDSHDNHLLDNSIAVQDPLLGGRSPQQAYIALKNGQAAAVILQATAPDGYSGAIRLLVGIYADGRLAGVRVLQHRETPGLGDKIDPSKSQWIHGFAGKSLENPNAAGWAVKKDRGEFDQFAGATITPRAVVKAVHNALLYFDAHRSELLGNGAPAADSISAQPKPQNPSVDNQRGTAP